MDYVFSISLHRSVSRCIVFSRVHCPIVSGIGCPGSTGTVASVGFDVTRAVVSGDYSRTRDAVVIDGSIVCGVPDDGIPQDAVNAMYTTRLAADNSNLEVTVRFI